MQRVLHMQRSADSSFRKLLLLSVFIFLFGLFAGLFFSIGLSEENTDRLSSSLISSMTDMSIGGFRIFMSALFSDLTTAALMLAAALSKLLCFLPFAVLWYESFAIGFCCGLIHLVSTENAIALSLTEILPPAIFFIPSFIILAAAATACSKNEILKSKRPSREGKSLIVLISGSLVAIVIGCAIEALCCSF